MFRCNQCPNEFEDPTAFKRHLSITHFNYYPYICDNCKNAGETHTTATEEDMDKHIETLHPANEYGSKSKKVKEIEDEIKAAIEKCRLPISQHISLDSITNMQKGSNVQNDQSSFGATAMGSGSTSSRVVQDQYNGVKIENIATDDTEIVYESVLQRGTGADTATKRDVSKSALRQGGIGTTSGRKLISITTGDFDFNEESQITGLSHENPTLLATESNLCANDSPIVALLELHSVQESPTMLNDTQSQAELNSVIVLDDQIDEENIRQDSAPYGQSTAVPIPSVEENVLKSEIKTDDEFNQIHGQTEASLGLKNALHRVYNVFCDETTVDTLAKEGECSSSEMNPELSNNEATENITANENGDDLMQMIVERESNVNLLENTSESRTKDLGRDSQATESNSCANDAPTQGAEILLDLLVRQHISILEDPEVVEVLEDLKNLEEIVNNLQQEQ